MMPLSAVFADVSHCLYCIFKGSAGSYIFSVTSVPQASFHNKSMMLTEQDLFNTLGLGNSLWSSAIFADLERSSALISPLDPTIGAQFILTSAGGTSKDGNLFNAAHRSVLPFAVRPV